MDKEIVTEAELLDVAVEHIHKSRVGRADSDHWPNHGPDIDRECLDHAIPGGTAKPGHVYTSICQVAGRKEGE